MRVSSVGARGRQGQTSKRRSVRPTLARVREALFNSLGEQVVGAEVLDLFAGTGALGIEALSRGASRAVFVERDARMVQLIRDTIKACGFEGQAEVWQADALKAPSVLARRGRRFQLIFLDPPYGQGLLPKAMDRIARAGILAEGGIVVAEGHWRDEPGDQVADLRLLKKARYGETVLWFYTRTDGASQERSRDQQ
ncbi:MAG: 16S rRNA (guanine(966)-N(2))-methyltransferase RsmD [Armatimonadota bacterium]|nr:16S rRNA (guanine(966)-N(2))-methyltransferase RsmD [Armatimonadota bacterium]MDR5703580.1 16S rRNA (guanine(966)-N(2))-methyltransferase RsmD [Armatimonadota bacterium]